MMRIQKQILITCLLALGIDTEGFSRQQTIVHQYLDARHGSPSLILANGIEEGIEIGDVYATYRRRPGSIAASELIPTGEIKVVASGTGYAVAEILVAETAISKILFPKFSSIMAGDLVKPKQQLMERRLDLLPETVVSYNELFISPKSAPTTFELSIEGKSRLRSLVAAYGEARIGQLMIYGYTDSDGAADINQIESYQRALTVRQFLVNELGFDEKRLVAIGHGENQPAVSSNIPGYREFNRRIVIRPISDAAKIESLSPSDAG